MTERPFFDKWMGKTIQLPTDESDSISAWILESVIGDKNNQLSAYEYHEDEILQESLSGAYGTFFCHNKHKPRDNAVMKVIMQVSHAGSEYAIRAERERQASKELSTFGYLEIEPLETLTKNNCPSTPRLRQHWATEQGNDETVSGGFLHYLLIEKLEGLQLSRDLFWILDRDERDQIRVAFKDAFENCIKAGTLLSQLDARYLMWDKKASKM
ncbi:hypothetical protein BJX62DRAFT_235782 [Aspergillus germanicus]